VADKEAYRKTGRGILEHRHRDVQVDRKTCGQTSRQTNDRETSRHRYRQTDVHTDKETYRQTERCTDRQKGAETDKETYI
jgi:hypothetical protein